MISNCAYSVIMLLDDIPIKNHFGNIGYTKVFVAIDASRM